VRARLRQAASVVFLLGVVLLSTGAGQEPTVDPIDALLQAGRFAEAFAAAVPEDERHDPAAVERFARRLLRFSMTSDDNYQRWFSLRAVRALDDAELAVAVLPLVHSGDRYVQSLALEILANSNPAAGREAFLEALDSPFRTVRIRALRGLEKLKDRTVVARLGTVLSADSDPELRALAARVLGETHSAQAIAVLLVGLDDDSVLVQEETVRALVALGYRDLSRVLRERLANGAPKDRIRAVRLIALVPDPGLSDVLAPLLGDGDPELRAYAAAAVVAIHKGSWGETH
jgi:HEAT repeat protein